MTIARSARRFSVLLALTTLSACSAEDTPPSPASSNEAHLAVLATSAPQPSQAHDFVIETLAEGLKHPWSVAFLPDGTLLISERAGTLRRLSPAGLSAPLTGVPQVVAENQGGLLDIALHPDFAEQPFVYLSYATACAEGGATTAFGRGRLADSGLVDFTELFAADACARGGRHHAGRLLFDRDGFLYLSVGDRGQDPRAQDTADHAGTLLRFNADGSVPADNPFVGDHAGLDEIWSYGHRNPQGLALHPDTGALWEQEHGPKGGDEINLIRPGINYGWPVITYGREYNGDYIGPGEQDGLEQPLKHWTPSIAPSGMTFYQGDAFPEWHGDIFVGALADTHLARVRFNGTEEVSEEKLLDNTGYRIRDVRTGPDGRLYLLTDAPDGKLLRLSPP